MQWLDGKKTYVVAVLMGLATAAKTLGWLDETAFLALMGFLNATGLGTLRAGVQKSGVQ